MKDYSKNPLSIEDQINLLESRGLHIPDRERVWHYLSYISYYRLRAYTYPYQDNDQPNHPFHTGITFDRILTEEGAIPLTPTGCVDNIIQTGSRSLGSNIPSQKKIKTRWLKKRQNMSMRGDTWPKSKLT